jgi:hypothetical protein
VVPIQDYTLQSPHLVDQVFRRVCLYVRVLVFACVLSVCVCVCVRASSGRLLECDSWHDIKSHGLRKV